MPVPCMYGDSLLEGKFPQRWDRRLDVTSGGVEFSGIDVVIVDPKNGTEEPWPPPAPAKK